MSENSLNASTLVSVEQDVILDSKSIIILREMAPTAILILKFNDELVQSVCVKDLDPEDWRLKKPNNPHLKGYRLEIKSRKFDFNIRQPKEDLPFHEIVEIASKEQIYEKIWKRIRNISPKTFAFFFAALAVIEFLVLIIVFNNYKEYQVHSLMKQEDRMNNSCESCVPVTRKITINYIRDCVKNLEYDGCDLSFDELLYLLAERQSEVDSLVEEKVRIESTCLENICNEVKHMQDGVYRNVTWQEYINVHYNRLRKNIYTLYRIDESVYRNLRHTLEPLFQYDKMWKKDHHRTTAYMFQKKYIPLADNYNNSNEVICFKNARTFSELRKLYDEFKIKYEGYEEIH